MRPNPNSTEPSHASAGATWRPAIKFFHWLIAALIFVQFALGWMASTWQLSPTKLNLFVWHKSTGMVVLALVTLRLLWRLATPAPPLPSDMPAWERMAAHASHALLYVLMFGIPITGWIVNSAAGVPFRIFWRVPLPAIVAADKHSAELAALAHFLLGMVLALLLVVHIGAALRHHFIKRDHVLARMLPFWTPPP